MVGVKERDTERERDAHEVIQRERKSKLLCWLTHQTMPETAEVRLGSEIGNSIRLHLIIELELLESSTTSASSLRTGLNLAHK